MEIKEQGKAQWSLIGDWRSILLSTIVAAPPCFDVNSNGEIIRVSKQWARWSAISAAAVGWFALLCLGVWGAIQNGPHRAVAAAVGLTLAGQMALHAVYGSPTFLYAAHFLPILMTLAAFAWFTPARRLLPAFALVVAALAAVANFDNFSEATAAEMLLLQLSMLADRDGDSVVIGAGVAPGQLGSTLSVSGVGIAGAFVDWAWSPGTLRVTLRGAARDLTVRLGPAFPAGTTVEVRREPAG